MAGALHRVSGARRAPDRPTRVYGHGFSAGDPPPIHPWTRRARGDIVDRPMRVTDFRHFLDASGFLPKERDAKEKDALRLARQLARIIEAASCREPGSTAASAVACTRRPRRRHCPGFLAVARSEVPAEIRWECPVCGDAGQIVGWTDTTWDLRGRLVGPSDAGAERLEVRFDPSHFRSLLDLDTLEWDSHVLLCCARSAREGIVLAASEEELAILADDVAAAASHASRPAHARRLRAALREIEDVLADGEPMGRRRRSDRVGCIEAVFQVQVRLQRVRPPVWRRLEISAGASLGVLHHAIQASFGWEDCHLHEFASGGQRIGPIDEWSDPELCDEDRLRIGDLLTRPGDSMLYVYDFGDDWRHTIELEDVLSAGAPHRLPRCTAGRASAPAEDSGPSGRSGGTSSAIDLAEVNAALDWLRER